MIGTGTYVYCLVVGARRPALTKCPGGLPGLGRVRLLEVVRGEWLIVADAPLKRYGENAINRRLSDLEWVSRTAVAHEAVVEAFIGAPAVLPMKLFTIFETDDRALEHLQHNRSHIDSIVRRVKHHHEWGVRVMLDRVKGAASGSGRQAVARGSKKGLERASGLRYLARKKAQRDATAELAERARETVAGLFDRLARQAGLAMRRLASELPVQGGPLLLDAAFLVPASRSRRFRASAAREARALGRQGYMLTLTGPWPPYSFIQG